MEIDGLSEKRIKELVKKGLEIEAKVVTEAQMCVYLGWAMGSDMPSGRDMDSTILKLNQQMQDVPISNDGNTLILEALKSIVDELKELKDAKKSAMDVSLRN
jgi:hypothetical protein